MPNGQVGPTAFGLTPPATAASVRRWVTNACRPANILVAAAARARLCRKFDADGSMIPSCGVRSRPRGLAAGPGPSAGPGVGVGGLRVMSAFGRGLPWLITPIIIVALTGAPARAQEDLDRDKSATKLFAANCAECHRSPRGLAKERFSFTLTLYLRQHYTSSAATAQALTAYLQAADAAARAKQAAGKKSRPSATNASSPRPPVTSATAAPLRPAATNASGPSMRPPAPIPAR
jgi:hypothetical protein